MSGIRSMYVDSSACVRVKGVESERFRIDSGVRHGGISESEGKELKESVVE